MMADLISRAAVLNALLMSKNYRDARDTLEQLPAVDAVPVEWLIDRANDPERAPIYRRYAQMLYEEWQKEQEA